MALIFINYRRQDYAGMQFSGVLRDELTREFGKDDIFMDSRPISAGVAWADQIKAEMQTACVVLVIIGPDWLKVSDEVGRRRLDLPGDWVRMEIEQALASGKTVIPVLLASVTMPTRGLPTSIERLVDLQAFSHDPEVEYSIGKLIPAIWRILETQSLRPWSRRPKPGPRPDELSDSDIAAALDGDIGRWVRQERPLTPRTSADNQPEASQVGLYREFRFRTFRDAIAFMYQMAPSCDIVNHHPIWENEWRAIRIFLTTWDIEPGKISDRDVRLAGYFDRAYETSPGRFFGEGSGQE